MAIPLPIPSASPKVSPLMNAATQASPAPAVYVPPEHGKHDKFDDADRATKDQDAKELQKQITADMKKMPGFVRVHKCHRCGKRIDAKTDDRGNVEYATCPHCKQGTYAESKTVYVGKVVKQTDMPHAIPKANLFEEGMKMTGFNARQRVSR